MTKQEKLNAVEKAIREALPRLTEPTEGCRILEHGEPLEQYAVILAQRLEDKYLIYIPYNSDNPCEEIDQKELSENYEILGHDILLSDVLEWLKELELSNEIDTFNIGYSEMGQFVILYDSKYYFWNLSKPYLKDQSEEFIEFLYNLIEK